MKYFELNLSRIKWLWNWSRYRSLLWLSI